VVFLVSRSQDPVRIHDDKILVFFNMNKANPFSLTIKKAGFVSRCYYLDDPDQYQKAKDFGAHHLATDRINPRLYPWTDTHDPKGRPFQVIDDEPEL